MVIGGLGVSSKNGDQALIEAGFFEFGHPHLMILSAKDNPHKAIVDDNPARENHTAGFYHFVFGSMIKMLTHNWVLTDRRNGKGRAIFKRIGAHK